MKKIRFIQIGEENTSEIYNLVDNLNNIQTFFEFIFVEDMIEESICQRASSNTLISKDAERKIRSYMTDNDYYEFPIGITSLPFEDEYIANFDSQYGIISTHDWESITICNLTKWLQYNLVPILLEMYFITNPHTEEPHECPNDFCENRSDFILGMKKAMFCSECEKKILSSIERGLLSNEAHVAIRNILDNFRGKIRVFVIMPFNKTYDEVYAQIKDYIIREGCDCERADEVCLSKPIVDIIFEYIGRANTVIAEVTERNANVYYELGYSNALAKNTILIAQSVDNIPFDIRHNKIIKYSTSNLLKLCIDLRNHL